jgi:hypothetical protein
MSDEQNAHVVIAPEPVDQRENLSLNGHVERGGRLVGDQQTRIAGHGERDHHALAHAAGHLVRIIMRAASGVGNLDAREHLLRAPPRRPPVEPEMQANLLRDLLSGAQHRVERSHRLLKDHRDLAAAQAPGLIRRGPGQIDHVARFGRIARRTRRDAAGGARQQAHDGEARH